MSGEGAGTNTGLYVSGRRQAGRQKKSAGTFPGAFSSRCCSATAMRKSEGHAQAESRVVGIVSRRSKLERRTEDEVRCELEPSAKTQQQVIVADRARVTVGA